MIWRRFRLNAGANACVTMPNVSRRVKFTARGYV